MEPGCQYNKLKTESTLFMNVLRMIAYRAESAVVNCIHDHYARAEDEGRMLVKEIIQSDADILPDYKEKILRVRLHSLSTPRANKTVGLLCVFLNETETLYPETDLKLVYETVSCRNNDTNNTQAADSLLSTPGCVKGDVTLRRDQES